MDFHSDRARDPKRNYHKELEKIIASHEKEEKRPSLLLHACCAPCSSHCLVFLRQFFDVTVFFYNPNITESEEYVRRVEEEKRLIRTLNEEEPGMEIGIVEGEYRPEDYFDAVRGLESEAEGGKRCSVCFELRLEETAATAAERGFDYFTTTLTISPLKDAERLNRIGEEAGARHGISFLPSDFKKKDGYLHSIRLSEQYGLYRQDHCGCVFSKREKKE